MKNFISFFALLLILSSSTSFRTNNAINVKKEFSKGPTVPATVVTSFNDITTSVIRFRFNDPNATIDTSAVTWIHDGQGLWVASGNVYVVGGGGTGINVSKASFRHNGNGVDYVYTLL